MNSVENNTVAKHQYGETTEVSVYDLVQVVLSYKLQLSIIALLSGFLSVIIAINLPDIYQSEVVVAPVVEDNVPELGSQFGGLASLAGLSLTQGDGKSKLALEILGSKQFIGDFVEKYQLTPELMASESWNRESNSFEYDIDRYDAKTETWIREKKQYLGPEPTVTEIHEEFSSMMSIDEDEGIVKISFSHYSPYLAKEILDLLVSEINLTLKLRDIDEARKSIDYLNKQIEQSQVAEVRSMLLSLIEKQVKKIMLAETKDEYVFTIIDPAVIADNKSKPKRALIVIIGILSGTFLAIIFFITRRLVFLK